MSKVLLTPFGWLNNPKLRGKTPVLIEDWVARARSMARWSDVPTKLIDAFTGEVISISKTHAKNRATASRHAKSLTRWLDVAEEAITAKENGLALYAAYEAGLLAAKVKEYALAHEKTAFTKNAGQKSGEARRKGFDARQAYIEKKVALGHTYEAACNFAVVEFDKKEISTIKRSTKNPKPRHKKSRGMN